MNGQSRMVVHIILNSCSLNLHCSGEWMNNEETPPQRFSYTSSVCVSLQCQKLSLETFHPYFQVSKDPTQNHNKNVPFTHDDQLYWILNYWWWWQSWRFNLQEWESVWRCDSRLVSLWGAFRDRENNLAQFGSHHFAHLDPPCFLLRLFCRMLENYFQGFSFSFSFTLSFLEQTWKHYLAQFDLTTCLQWRFLFKISIISTFFKEFQLARILMKRSTDQRYTRCLQWTSKMH